MANELIHSSLEQLWAHVLTKLNDTEEKIDSIKLDNYATKEFVSDNTSQIHKIFVNGIDQNIVDRSVSITIPDPDLSGYATKDEVAKSGIHKISVNGVEQYIDGTFVDLEIPAPDLSSYATKEFVNTNGGKIDKISVNGVEQEIVDKSVNLKIKSTNETTEDTVLYLTGVKNSDSDAYYNSAINFNPATGELNAKVVRADKVYGAVWNDYAEWFEKQYIDMVFEPGDICAWDKTGVIKATSYDAKKVIGVFSDSFGHILGGEPLKDMNQNLAKYVPIGLVGRVKVKVVGPAEIGDYIVPSPMPGVGIVDNTADFKTVIGQVLENKTNNEVGRVTIFIK